MSAQRNTIIGLFVLIGLLCTAYLTIKLGRMEVLGDSEVTGIKVENNSDHTVSEIPCQGLFVALGHAGELTDQKRLDDPLILDGDGKFAESGVVEVLSGLVLAGNELGEGQLASFLAGIFRCRAEEGTETSAKTAFGDIHRCLLSFSMKCSPAAAGNRRRSRLCAEPAAGSLAGKALRVNWSGASRFVNDLAGQFKIGFGAL